MNYHLFEKTLLKPIIVSNILLTLHTQQRKRSKPGYLYTLCRKTDKTIKLGFTQNPKESQLYDNNMDYEILEIRSGTEREFKLLSMTLNEIGYKEDKQSSGYSYSKILIKHLALLGWPLGSLRKTLKKRYSKV